MVSISSDSIIAMGSLSLGYYIELKIPEKTLALLILGLLENNSLGLVCKKEMQESLQ